MADRASTENKLLLLRTRDPQAWDPATLIEWSRDPDDAVRDWATFALAAREDDSDDIRNALFERIDDADFDASSEAIWGLARRQDPRTLQPLIEALRGEIVGELFVEAAGYMARPELVDPLEELMAENFLDAKLMASALARCRGEHDPESWRWSDIVTKDD